MQVAIIFRVAYVLLSVPLVSGEDYMDAIFVAMSRNISGSANPVKFDREEVDVRGAYDSKGHIFYASKAGAYWVALSEGAFAGKYGIFLLYRESKAVASVFRDTAYTNGIDTLSRDIIVPMNALQPIKMRSSSSHGLYSDDGLQTALSLFRLTDLMLTSVYFSAVRDTDFSGSTGATLQFQSTLVNEGNAFVLHQSMLHVPKAGLYFLSYSAGLNSGNKVDLVLKRNAVTISSLERYSTKHGSWDSMSRSSLYYLNKGDLVYISFNISSHLWSSSSSRAISFSGFLYEPIHGHKIAWSVAKTTCWNESTWAPVTFDAVLVNEGGQWNKERQVFICPTTGVYYITMSIGVQPSEPVHVTLMVDMVKKLVLNRYSTVHNGIDMLSRSAVLFLEAGASVGLIAEGGTAVYSSIEKQTTFSGLFLFPAPKPKK